MDDNAKKGNLLKTLADQLQNGTILPKCRIPRHIVFHYVARLHSD